MYVGDDHSFVCVASDHCVQGCMVTVCCWMPTIGTMGSVLLADIADERSTPTTLCSTTTNLSTYSHQYPLIHMESDVNSRMLSCPLAAHGLFHTTSDYYWTVHDVVMVWIGGWTGYDLMIQLDCGDGTKSFQPSTDQHQHQHPN